MQRVTPGRKTRIAVLTIAAALVAIAAAALLFRPPRVTVAAVAERDLAPAIHAVGTVEVKALVHVGAKIAGRITTVAVDQGDIVERGQRLVQLDAAQLAAEVRRAAAAVEATEAQRLDVEAGARSEEIAEARANARRARAQLDELLAGSRPQEIEEVRERLRAATATRVLAERDFQRAARLHRDELIAAQEVDRARHAYEVAQAQERGAAETLQMAIEGPRPELIESARAQAVATEARLALLLAGTRPHQIAASRAQAQEARAALALARERLEDATVRSPLDGLVVSRELEPGATVNAGTAILKIVDPRTAWATVHVDERWSGLIAVGDPAQITLRSRSSAPLPGRVTRVRRESDRVTEQLAVDVAFDAPPRRLTLGEQVEAVITPAARQALAIPAGAVTRGRDGAGTWLVVDGRLRFRPIRTGATDAAGWVEVLDGLRAGEQVVVGPGRLADPASEGRRVR